MISRRAPYRAVVAGSAIRGAKWLPEALRFMQTNQATLPQKPFAVFLVCITLAMKNGDKYWDRVANWLAPVRSLVEAVSEGLFCRGIGLQQDAVGLRYAAHACGSDPRHFPARRSSGLWSDSRLGGQHSAAAYQIGMGARGRTATGRHWFGLVY